ncbi:unnamed protein product, partial [Bubo scandiacus]
QLKVLVRYLLLGDIKIGCCSLEETVKWHIVLFSLPKDFYILKSKAFREINISEHSVNLTEFVGYLTRSICLLKFFWKKVNLLCDLAEVCFDAEGHFKGILLQRCLEESQKNPAS